MAGPSNVAGPSIVANQPAAGNASGSSGPLLMGGPPNASLEQGGDWVVQTSQADEQAAEENFWPDYLLSQGQASK